MEIVQGKREAVYWEKVPEKVRWKAVEIAVSAAQVSQSHVALQAPKGTGAKVSKRKRDK